MVFADDVKNDVKTTPTTEMCVFLLKLNKNILDIGMQYKKI